MSRRTLVLVGLALVLAAVNGLVASREAVLRSGEPLFLELAPVDPRSLIQGDYMRLDYAVARDLGGDLPPRGRLVLRRDARGVGTFVRLDRGEPLAGGEVRLGYRLRQGRVVLGAESFLFQEGHADRYARARFAELRVSPSGAAVLVGLRGEDLEGL